MSEFVGSTVHAELGAEFFDPVRPAAFSRTILRYRNQAWAERMGLGDLDQAGWLDHFARFVPLEGSFAAPLALRYHGHQFGIYNPDLGDGRGFLFAQGFDRVDGVLRDLGTKGSGTTPWSRGGDGRLTLKGGVRELLASAMLEALGVNTSKTFSLVETGEALKRQDEPSPARGAVLVRLSHSHIRIGTFQRLAYLEDEAALGRLLEHCVVHYMPGHVAKDVGEVAGRAVAFLEWVAGNVATTGARWIAAGFVHGVLNTDNINITGESFDYGPWRFVPRYDPGFVAAYFDEAGLYAFGRQPDALAWNLTRLAECLLPLAPLDRLETALNSFWPRFRAELARAVLDRLGLRLSGDAERDGALAPVLFGFLRTAPVPYERFFFDWRGGVLGAERAVRSPYASAYAEAGFHPLAAALERFEPVGDAGLGHAYFARTGPRTMLIEEVEAIWAAIAESDDWDPLYAALDEIALLAEASGTAVNTAADKDEQGTDD